MEGKSHIFELCFLIQNQNKLSCTLGKDLQWSRSLIEDDSWKIQHFLFHSFIFLSNHAEGKRLKNYLVKDFESQRGAWSEIFSSSNGNNRFFSSSPRLLCLKNHFC